MHLYEIVRRRTGSTEVPAWGLTEPEAQAALDLVADRWRAAQPAVGEGQPGYRHIADRDPHAVHLYQEGVGGNVDAHLATWLIREDGGAATHPTTPRVSTLSPEVQP